MPPKKHPTVWKAEPHTIAKIEILKKYLVSWFQIMGQSPAMAGKEILYVDGFAGPGKYTNHSEGSPLAALLAAREALDNSSARWKAGAIHCAFVEDDRDRFFHLEAEVAQFDVDPRLKIHPIHTNFIDGIDRLRNLMPRAFSESDPLFVFIDPFGASDVPFSIVADLLMSSRSEILLNFDADGMSRIFKAGQHSNHEAILSTVYGNESWREELNPTMDFDDLYRTAKDLYLKALRTLPNIQYTFPFEMQKSRKLTNYYLIFAGQHRLGLVKMKEAMRKIDQTGQYQFADAHVGQAAMFRWDEPEIFAPRLHQKFEGAEVSYFDVWDYALNETPFENPKSMLKLLDLQNRIEVIGNDPNRHRRKGTFNESHIHSIKFIKGD